MSKNIVVIGSSNTDLFMKVTTIPKPGETVIGGEIYKSLGGKGANQAVAASRVGGNITFICSLGDDIYGKESIQSFSNEGISVEHIKIEKSKASGLAMIIVDRYGENIITVASGANECLTPEYIESLKQVIKNADLLLMQLEIPVETVRTAAKIAYENNVKVMLNPAPARELTGDLLSYISILTPNVHEAETLSGIKIKSSEDIQKAANVFLRKGIETVIITQGSKGVYCESNNCNDFIPSFSVDAVDTTAAGDIFNGVLAVRISEGFSFPEAIKYASAAAAISVTRLGSLTSAPFQNEINQFLLKNSLVIGE